MKPAAHIKQLNILILFISGSVIGLSQDGGTTPVNLPEDDDVTTQLWLDYNPRKILNTKSSLYASTGIRTGFTDDQYRFYTRPTYRYDITRLNQRTDRYRTWQLIAGMGLFYNWNPYVTDVLEIRPFQGLKVRFPNFDRVHLTHYFRLEERIEIGFGPADAKFSMRGRYKIGTDLYLPGKLLFRGIYLPVYAEFFFNFASGAQFNDVMRFTPGLGYEPNSNWKFQFELSYHRSRPTSSDKFQTNDIVFRFRVYQVL
jgi:hypothetical protein